MIETSTEPGGLWQRRSDQIEEMLKEVNIAFTSFSMVISLQPFQTEFTAAAAAQPDQPIPRSLTGLDHQAGCDPMSPCNVPAP